MGSKTIKLDLKENLDIRNIKVLSLLSVLLFCNLSFLCMTRLKQSLVIVFFWSLNKVGLTGGRAEEKVDEQKRMLKGPLSATLLFFKILFTCGSFAIINILFGTCWNEGNNCKIAKANQHTFRNTSYSKAKDFASPCSSNRFDGIENGEF